MENLIQKVKAALAIIAEGRGALGEVMDTIKDGKAGIAADTIGEIDGLLEQERIENRATNEGITDAIADFRRRFP